MERLGSDDIYRALRHAGHTGVEKLSPDTACYLIGAALAAAAFNQLQYPVITADPQQRTETIRQLIDLAGRISARAVPSQSNVDAVALRTWEDFFLTAPDSAQATALAAHAVSALPDAFAALRIERTEQFLSRVIQSLTQNTRGYANQKGDR